MYKLKLQSFFSLYFLDIKVKTSFTTFSLFFGSLSATKNVIAVSAGGVIFGTSSTLAFFKN